MKLVIVESPAKAKTIQKYLGRDFVVKSSYGHIRDLPKSKLGVDTAKNFTPTYVIPDKAKKQVAELKKAAKKADEIYFATDEDREGEAIAWHLQEILKFDPKKIHRITFSQITKDAIVAAVANPRQIDANMVDAQQARRVLDRLVGYELSPLLWKKIRRGLSAGRVQSVAVRLIVEREEEIKAFKSEEYWTLLARLDSAGNPFEAQLVAKNNQRLTKLGIKTKKEMDTVVADLAQASYKVTSIKSTDRKRTPPAPFTTSTLQQSAVNTLGFSSKKTMMVAQQLYEGINLGDAGPTGLITYMRTDSTNLAAEAIKGAQAIITQEFGGEYSLAQPRVFKKKSKGAQEAHEAVRPTDPARTPAAIASFLSGDQLKLYTLIWQRMVASQMKDALLKQVSADITAGSGGAAATYTFRASGTTVVFDGYVRALGAKAAFKETVLPDLKKNDELLLKSLQPEQHFTEGPARYSEATLVKALEEYGIGRPSTYAPTIDTVQRREYVRKNDDRRFEPSEVGTLVTKLLIQHFPNIVDLAFTATMEENLDLIAAGTKAWRPVVAAFYEPFHQDIINKDKEISKEELTQEKTGETCPKCKQGEIVIKLGRFGKFKACSNYPTCKHTEAFGAEKALQDEFSQEKCPDCGKPLVVKRGRFGPFLGCSGYPDCKHIKKIEKTTGVKCPKCQRGDIVEKRSKRGRNFYACNQYPECANAYWSKPTGQVCPDCKNLLVFGAKGTERCSNKECKFSQPLQQDNE